MKGVVWPQPLLTSEAFFIMAKESKYEPGLLRYVFDPLKDIKVRKGEKRDTLVEIRDFLRNAILAKVSTGTSPVSGEGKFTRLSKQYAKSEKRGNTTPNLQLTGDMLAGLNVSITREGRIATEFKGRQAEKADGHSKLTGRSNNLPRRRVIPGETQQWQQQITRGIRSIVKDREDGDNS